MDLNGFDGFINAWVYTGGPVVIVDVGPAVCAGHLHATLIELGIHKPDFILLTHIHLDHAGGIGTLAKAYPDTPVVCHPKAIDHLIDPQKLWQGSLNTLGTVAQQYGRIDPVPAEQLMAADQLTSKRIKALSTPGHAAHHYSYIIGDLLFAGEVGGVCITLPDGTFYLRPATPPRFYLETYLESIDRLIGEDFKHICYGHIGVRSNGQTMLQHHRSQLLKWRRWVEPWCHTSGDMAEDRVVDQCLADLLNRDRFLNGFTQLSGPAQERERFFLRNSIKGYREFIDYRR